MSYATLIRQIEAGEGVGFVEARAITAITGLGYVTTQVSVHATRSGTAMVHVRTAVFHYG